MCVCFLSVSFTAGLSALAEGAHCRCKNKKFLSYALFISVDKEMLVMW
jgi:hypothetical protein